MIQVGALAIAVACDIHIDAILELLCFEKLGYVSLSEQAIKVILVFVSRDV